MRILQTSSDWKWTGPAAPMLELALALRARGHAVELACPEAPEGEAGLAARARAAGLPPALALSRGRAARPLRDRDDVRRLRAHLADGGFDVVHAWHTRDHVLARRAGAGRRRAEAPALVRSWPRAEAPRSPGHRALLGPFADAVWCVSPESAARLAPLRRGRPVAGGFGAVDLARFRPGPSAPAARARLGLAAGDRVVGTVARVQPQRRFDLLLAAAARWLHGDPRARLVVVGRGTRRAELAERPAARLGIADRVVFAGHVDAGYPELLRALDVFTLLAPGSDGTCRAALEAAATGLPAVVTARGALPEIVRPGETGLVVPEDPDALARAWQELLASPERRARMGAAARRRAESRFAPARLAAEVEALYARALRLGRASAAPSVGSAPSGLTSSR